MSSLDIPKNYHPPEYVIALERAIREKKMEQGTTTLTPAGEEARTAAKKVKGAINVESHNQTGGITAAKFTGTSCDDVHPIVLDAEPKTFEEAVHRKATEIAELVISKQRDYGHGNILAFGETGILVRMSDKMERLKNLHKRQQAGQTTPANEPMLDSLTDMAGYAILGLMLDKGWFTLELSEDQ